MGNAPVRTGFLRGFGANPRPLCMDLIRDLKRIGLHNGPIARPIRDSAGDWRPSACAARSFQKPVSIAASLICYFIHSYIYPSCLRRKAF